MEVKDLVEEAEEQIEHEEHELSQLLSACEAFQDDDDDGDVVAPHPEVFSVLNVDLILQVSIVPPLKETAGWSHFL